ncbi:hypothetical protein Tfer_2274 [Thermincola ferriacetica]|uniref:Arginase n=1 Tax=Thermincola ferriacetica TaxID=281456 RepID=A0A0L6W262_9FIRM|nr:hypothetical protein [Thermincola ferriacetica]KNZ69169.1 hypothetical protein Tfer_2274 [Thermincola ferriacetica]
MGKNLLSIDWDYFVPIKKEWYGSYSENQWNVNKLWYRRYIKEQMRGEDITRTIDVGVEYVGFWKRIRSRFRISDTARVYISDSHKYSYGIARENACDAVYLFDAHADLGYGGIGSLDFELNCANWLGKLFKNNHIREASVIYSPYTFECPEDFIEINNAYNINYCELERLPEGIPVDVIHICRSGAWTPPWLDHKFLQFVYRLNRPVKWLDCPPRRWNAGKLTLSAQLNYLLY